MARQNAQQILFGPNGRPICAGPYRSLENLSRCDSEPVSWAQRSVWIFCRNILFILSIPVNVFPYFGFVAAETGTGSSSCSLR